jgi:hypothetical protein
VLAQLLHQRPRGLGHRLGLHGLLDLRGRRRRSLRRSGLRHGRHAPRVLGQPGQRRLDGRDHTRTLEVELRGYPRHCSRAATRQVERVGVEDTGHRFERQASPQRQVEQRTAAGIQRAHAHGKRLHRHGRPAGWRRQERRMGWKRIHVRA